jgi:hypothetical protein
MTESMPAENEQGAAILAAPCCTSHLPLNYQR